MGTHDGNTLSEVIAELSFETPVARAELESVEHSCAACFLVHRVALVRVFLTHSCTRAVLVFRAPDAESVRLACRPAGLRFERVRARRHRASLAI